MFAVFLVVFLETETLKSMLNLLSGEVVSCEVFFHMYEVLVHLCLL
jgi:hypothetical protein